MDLLEYTVLYIALAAFIAVAVFAVVVIGMKGRYRSRYPGIAYILAHTARALNGDAKPPNAFQKLVNSN